MVLGGEGEGLRPAVLARAQYRVGIQGARDVDEVGVDSLNVSVASALLCARFMERGGGEAREGRGREKEKEKEDREEGLLF